MQWLRRSFIAGFFVTVPLVISVAAFVWIFRLIDGFVGPFYAAWLNRNVPGLGILTTALFVLLVGAVATNVIGKRLLQKTEGYLLRVPVFRTIYAPVKQLIVAFSPDNEHGFKRVVLVEEPGGASCWGFSRGSSRWIAAGVPSRSWPCTCRPIICILGTCSCVPGTAPRSPTSPWSRQSEFSSPAGWRSRAVSRRGAATIGWGIFASDPSFALGGRPLRHSSVVRFEAFFERPADRARIAEEMNGRELL